jgi:hypothetical protein
VKEVQISLSLNLAAVVICGLGFIMCSVVVAGIGCLLSVGSVVLLVDAAAKGID